MNKPKLTREALSASWDVIQEHEVAMTLRFVRGARSIPGVRLYGVTDEVGLSLT